MYGDADYDEFAPEYTGTQATEAGRRAALLAKLYKMHKAFGASGGGSERYDDMNIAYSGAPEQLVKAGLATINPTVGTMPHTIRISDAGVRTIDRARSDAADDRLAAALGAHDAAQAAHGEALARYHAEPTADNAKTLAQAFQAAGNAHHAAAAIAAAHPDPARAATIIASHLTAPPPRKPRRKPA